MIEERYCSFELSKLLKEKGFDVECDYYYFLFNEGIMSGYKEFCHYNHNMDAEKCSAPTHQMACDWLREDSCLAINVSGHGVDVGRERTDKFAYDYEIVDMRTFTMCEQSNQFDDYAECVESAIKYCLTELM